MTSAQSPTGLPAAAVAAGDLTDAEETRQGGPTVGNSDADADAARSGVDVEIQDAQRDSDGVPVGSDDADEDARQSGADAD